MLEGLMAFHPHCNSVESRALYANTFCGIVLESIHEVRTMDARFEGEDVVMSFLASTEAVSRMYNAMRYLLGGFFISHDIRANPDTCSLSYRLRGVRGGMSPSHFLHHRLSFGFDPLVG
jgi:hypothetical protein